MRPRGGDAVGDAVFVGDTLFPHPPTDRAPRAVCTVAEQRAANIHVHDGVTEAEFVAMRSARDATLEMPQLMLPSVQVNIRAGQLPPAEDNGVAYLKIPVNAL